MNLAQNDRITNRGASYLSSLSKLKALNLSYTRVNFEGLRHFSGLLQLQSLALYGHSGSPDIERIRSLQRDLPNLKCLRITSNGSQDGSTGDENREYDSDLDENDVLSIDNETNFSNDESIISEGVESTVEDEDFLEGNDIQDHSE